MGIAAAAMAQSKDSNTLNHPLPWMHPFREHPLHHQSIQLDLPNLSDSPETMDVPMSRANSTETAEDTEDGRDGTAEDTEGPTQDTPSPNRIELINRISEKLQRDSHLFGHHNEHHSRNNTENEEDDAEYVMAMPIPTVRTPRSSPPLQSVIHKKRRNSHSTEIPAIAEQHEPTEYDTAFSYILTVYPCTF